MPARYYLQHIRGLAASQIDVCHIHVTNFLRTVRLFAQSHSGIKLRLPGCDLVGSRSSIVQYNCFADETANPFRWTVTSRFDDIRAFNARNKREE
jgi:hypothetical protein